MSSLRESLRELRKARGWTQKQMAARLNISHKAYSSYESGAVDPKLDNLLKLAQLLSVTVDHLLFFAVAEESDSPASDPMMIEFKLPLPEDMRRLITAFHYFTEEQQDNFVELAEEMALQHFMDMLSDQ